MKLISMTEFVLEQEGKHELFMPSMYPLYRIFKYANFLKQPLKLEMFVPCDDDGNVLSEPKNTGNDIIFTNKEYVQAKEKVLFEGFEKSSQKDAMHYGIKKAVDNYGKDSLYITIKKSTGYHSYFVLPTIEDLVQCKVTLTESAKKQIGI